MTNIVNQLKSGVKFAALQEKSYKYLGGGQYKHLDFHITPEGIDAGWIYEYPCLKFSGKMYLDAGKTIEQGIMDGHLAPDVRVSCQI